LLKDLMTYLLEIFRDYKVEVKEFLANDPTLLQEIEYDARQAHGAKENHSQ
jgi:condensin-2 complex subunit D3